MTKTHETIFKPLAIILWAVALAYVGILLSASEIFIPAYFFLTLLVILAIVFTKWAYKYPTATTEERNEILAIVQQKRT